MSILGLFPQVGPGGAVVFCLWLTGILLGHQQLWRVPLLILFTVLLAIDFAIYLGARLFVRVSEILLGGRLLARKNQQKKMQRARNYAEWEVQALQMDERERRQQWKTSDVDDNYDPRVVRAAVERLRDARAQGDLQRLLEVVRPCLVKNFGGVMNPTMYQKTHCGTKCLIWEFIEELDSCLRHLADLAAKDPSVRERLRGFVPNAVRSFGKTSLLLSGGAGLGFYHLGILRAFLAEGLLPQVLCGTSMGSIVLAFLASRTDAEALEALRNSSELLAQMGPEGGPMRGSKLWKMWQVLRRGYIYETKDMEQHLQWFTQGMTFLEAHRKTGRTVNITCTPGKTKEGKGLPPMLLNHLTAPNVTIVSAVLASSCVPCLIPPVELQEKFEDGSIRPYEGTGTSKASLDVVRMRDGSFESDVPVHAMGAFFNSQFNIVSQVNPHIIPFFFNPEGAPGRPIRWPWRTFRGGFILTLIVHWAKEDMLKLLRVMRVTGLLFRVFGVDWSYLFLQEAQGDITIVPNAGLRDYWRIMDNLASREELETKLWQSERSAWRHFTIIRNRLRVEHALEALEAALLPSHAPS